MASNRCYREIRPAFESDAIPTSPTSPRNPHHASSPRSDQKPARRNVWVACESCKKRKTKCSADRPKCSQCTSRGFDCRYTADPSESRSASMKRKFTELERQNDCLNGFFRAIRSMPEFQAHEVLRRIRSGASAEDVLREVEGGTLPASRRGQPVQPESPVQRNPRVFSRLRILSSRFRPSFPGTADLPHSAISRLGMRGWQDTGPHPRRGIVLQDTEHCA
ncbi:C6 transcription factor [Colletotrichum asianum]|uniref:C6 transcription factor n=1 Tax=Colletotrichum asianum TaxID=702518 RepID=A0A8H3W6H2_9PEZI|nr:C6 transcription factor [Colletotrichum asianum]